MEKIARDTVIVEKGYLTVRGKYAVGHIKLQYRKEISVEEVT